MSEDKAAPEAARQLETGPVAPVQLLGQYIKDLSFEVPLAPEIFNILREQPPEIPVSLDTSMRHLDGNTYEVILSAQLKALVGDKVAFILELEYACVAEVLESQIAQELIHPMLMIEVPRMMFPFARQIISDLTVGGGFPPLMLQLVDFAELYRAKFGVQVQPTDAAAQPTIN